MPTNKKTPGKRRPKKKVPTEEELKETFDNWKQTDQAKRWEAMGELVKETQKKYGRITSTTKDITGDWSFFLVPMFQYFSAEKQKNTKIKVFEQEFIRSIFFGRQDTDDNNDGTDHHRVKYDGVYCGVIKEHGDRVNSLRLDFMNLYTYWEEFEDIEPANLAERIKKCKEAMKSFLKYYVGHQKHGHKDIYHQKMALILEPFKKLIDINFEYHQYNLKNKTEFDYSIRDFKIKAVIEKYITYLTEVNRVLADENEKASIPCKIDVKRLFYKLEYTGWANNEVEKLYLQPLNQRFQEFQQCLDLYYYKGIHYWKIPLEKNLDFVAKLNALINSELIAENLIGNPLKRDQLNFFYKNIKLLDDSDKLIQKNLQSKDKNCLEVSIPQLIAFKQMQHFRQYTDKKRAYLENQEMQMENLSMLQTLKSEELNSTYHVVTDPTALVKGYKAPKTIQEIKDEVSEEQRHYELFGRYFILEGYLSEKSIQMLEKGSDLLQYINEAVQQDITDYILKESMTPKTGMNAERKKEVRLHKDSRTAEEHADKTTKLSRPPQLWNYPKIVQEEHQFRCIADPKESYIDERIEQLQELIVAVAKDLRKFYKTEWNETVSRTIDVFKKSYEDNIKSFTEKYEELGVVMPYIRPVVEVKKDSEQKDSK